MRRSILDVEAVTKCFNGVTALDEFSCSVSRGELVGLIGPNGAGKTTLFNVLTGFLRPDSGKVSYCGHGLLEMAPHQIVRLGISRTFQEIRPIVQLSVLDNTLLSYCNQPGEHLWRAFLQPRSCMSAERVLMRKAMELLEVVGLSHCQDSLAGAISYGQQKLLSLARCLAADADLLLLDEPVAGVAPPVRKRILEHVQQLPQRGKTVVLIEHDVEAVWGVCERVVFMDAGRKVCEGTPDEVRNDTSVIHAYLG